MTLEVRHVSKAFGGMRILDEVSLTVSAEARVGLIGPNGAGKSTLFAVISGFEPGDAGEIRFDGADISHATPQARVARGLIRSFQVPRPFTHLTVRENLAVAAPGQRGERLLRAILSGAQARREQAEIATRANEIIAFLRLSTVAETPAGQLSGGQRKLLEIGRIMMCKPRMILLDEPFAGVNPVLYGEISERILELNTKGIGFLIVEHNLPALTRVVETLWVLDRGRVLAHGTPDAVLADEAVRDAYIGGGR